MRTIGIEGRCIVVSANQCVKRSQLPEWITRQAASSNAQAEEDPNSDAFVSRGGSCIVSPFGEILSGPLWEVEDQLLVTEVDFEDCERGRLDLDVAGSYGRLDSFHFSVDGLDTNPPPF